MPLSNSLDVADVFRDRAQSGAASVPHATKVGVGLDVGCAAVDDGILCWGTNKFGQLGPLDSVPPSAAQSPRPIAVAPGARTRDLVVGNASFALLDDGTAVSWGANPPLARVSSLFPDPNPLPIALVGVTSIDVANDNACATAGGAGYCWGAALRKPDEQYSGTVPSTERVLPTPVVAPEPIVQIATTITMNRSVRSGGYKEVFLAPQRWCAVGASGAVYCWGDNTGGQAGDGTKNHAYEAVRVDGLPGPAAQVKRTVNASCAMLTSGKVHCWGTDYYGQLGNGELKVASLAPVEVVLP